MTSFREVLLKQLLHKRRPLRAAELDAFSRKTLETALQVHQRLTELGSNFADLSIWLQSLRSLELRSAETINDKKELFVTQALTREEKKHLRRHRR
jgi:hypothetical protein